MTIQEDTVSRPDPAERIVRRDDWGLGVTCAQPGCYEIGLEPDGKCERHGVYGKSRRPRRSTP